MEPATRSVDQKASHSSRYGLTTLFYVTAVIAAAIALLGAGGIWWAIFVLVFWYFQIRNSKRSIAKIFALLAVVGILIWMSYPPIGAFRLHAIRSEHLNRTRQICLAIYAYHEDTGHFPPAYIADDDGKPMHSWRVLVLPYLEEQALFNQYDFNEPWNGPNNSKLVNKLQHDTFDVDPAESRSGMTGFKLITGPETAFVEDQTKGFSDITAGLSEVIMLVDDNTKPVNWMSPEDLPLEGASKLFSLKNAKPRWVLENKFASRKYYFNHVGMFDGSVDRAGFLEDTSSMREHFTIAASPATHFRNVDFTFQYAERESKLGGYLLVAINFCLAVLPIFWAAKRT